MIDRDVAAKAYREIFGLDDGGWSHMDFERDYRQRVKERMPVLSFGKVYSLIC